MKDNHYEVLIVGAGISGAALAYELARYTNAKSIAILEKYEKVTHSIHMEKPTHRPYTSVILRRTTLFPKPPSPKNRQDGRKVLPAAQTGERGHLLPPENGPGCGGREVEFMLERYEEFKDLFPNLRVWDKEHLKTVEPKLVFDENGKERPETIVGIGSQGEWTTVDYGKMTASLIDNATKEPGTEVDLFLNT